MKYYGKITDPKDLVTKEYADSKQAKVTASGILKGDGNGGVSAATAGTDYVTPAQSLAIGLTGASVGDLVRVNAVDFNGKPTSWRPVSLSKFKCNKNLLDNWFFAGGGSQLGYGVFPINQRGQTVYGNRWTYAIDRWINWGTTNSSNFSVESEYISAHTIDQFTRDNLTDGVYTGSVLLADGRLFTGKATYAVGTTPALINTDTIDMYMMAPNNDNHVRIRLQNKTSQSGQNIKAVKLELGSEQTLAHQENGVWVLNEIPDYGEELRKCQTSRADSTDTYANQEIAIINRNPGAHNSIYRGKYLGSSVTAEQYAAIGAGTFDDLYIGDYWTIGGVNYRIAAFDYWLYCGDTECTTHHVVIVPDTRLYNAQMHNTESGAYTEGAANNPVTGAYVGSDMYTTNLAQAKTTINNAFGSAHILNHREYLKNAVNGAYESAGAWYDSTVELMTEQMVYGGKIFANALQAGNWAAQYTIGKSQLPLFALEPSRICIRAYWWLRDVASSTNFAHVTYYGNAHANYSSYSYGVRPAFGIKA